MEEQKTEDYKERLQKASLNEVFDEEDMKNNEQSV